MEHRKTNCYNNYHGKSSINDGHISTAQFYVLSLLSRIAPKAFSPHSLTDENKKKKELKLKNKARLPCYLFILPYWVRCKYLHELPRLQLPDWKW